MYNMCLVDLQMAEIQYITNFKIEQQRNNIILLCLTETSSTRASHVPKFKNIIILLLFFRILETLTLA